MSSTMLDAAPTGNRPDALTRLWQILTSGWWAAVVLVCLGASVAAITAWPGLRVPAAAGGAGVAPGEWLMRLALALAALTLLVRLGDRVILAAGLRRGLERARDLYLDEENACLGDLPLESTDGRLAEQVRRDAAGRLFRIWPDGDDGGVWIERLSPAVWSDVVLHLGALLLVAGLFVSAEWGWIEPGLALAAGETTTIGRAPGASLSVESVAGDGGGSLVVLTGPSGGRSAAQVSAMHPLIGSPAVFHSAVGPALRVAVDDSAGRKLLLQPSGNRARPATSVALKFPSGQDESYVTVPSLGLSLRVVRYDSLPEEGYYIPVYLVRAYQGNQAVPLFTRHVWQDTSYTWQSYTFHLAPEQFGLFSLASDPGWWPVVAGALLLVLGAVVRRVSGPLLVRVTRPDLAHPEQVEIEVWSRRALTRSGVEPAEAFLGRIRSDAP